MTGEGRIGLDDLVQKTLGSATSIELPEPGRNVRRGETLFRLDLDGQRLTFASPLSGKVVHVNHDLDYQMDLMRLRPYDQGWICTVDPQELTADLARLVIGADAVERYQTDARRYTDQLQAELAAEPAVHGQGPRPNGVERSRTSRPLSVPIQMRPCASTARLITVEERKLPVPCCGCPMRSKRPSASKRLRPPM